MPKSEFYNYLQFEKRFSQHTLISYRNDVEQFTRYCSTVFQIEDPVNVSQQEVRSWVVELINQGISPRSVNRKIASLRSFYKFLLREGEIDETPMTRITAPRQSQRLPVFVEEFKINQLLDQDNFEEDITGVRDRLIITMFYSMGIRLSELINMKRSNVDLESKTIKVVGKRNKERIIPISAELSQAIYCYETEKEKKGLHTKYIFCTDKGEKLYEKLVYRVVNNYLSSVTTLTKASPHVLRHTFATHMLNNGADINSIKELLGHANLSATQIYTHNTFDKLKTIYKQAHPRA